MFTQFSQAASDASDGENVIASSVSSLLLSSGPLAVAGLIAFVVIDPIKTGVRRALAYILEKAFKRLFPPITYGNASASVIGICLLGSILTSVDYVLPDHVNRSFHASHRLTVGEEGISHPLFPETAARFRIAAAKRSVKDNACGSAFTKALALAKGITAEFAPWFSFGNYRESSKLFSDDGYCGRHTDGGSSVVFSSGRPASTGAHCDYGHSGIKNKT